MSECNRLGERVVCSNASSQSARDLGHLEDMVEPCAGDPRRPGAKQSFDLRLVLEFPKRSAVDDSVAVDLEA
jgi:hypothetical protein